MLLQVQECLCKLQGVGSDKIIDNHDSGYLGMAVQLYVQAHLGHYHILQDPEAKTDGTAEIYAPF